MRYLIFSLGRSRTAWLAHFLPKCGHETLGLGHSLTGLEGLADTTLILDWRAALKRFPEALPIVIHRDPFVIRKSFEAHGVSGKIIANLYPRLLDLMRHGAMSFEFNDLNERMPELWAAVSDEPFPVERFNELRDVNIDRISAHLESLRPEQAKRIMENPCG